MAKKRASYNFDFEAWANLAKSDPERFEVYRSDTIEAMINNCPDDKQQQLRGLQWRVDRTRELKRTPMAACIAISEMMWGAFHNLNRSYLQLSISMNPDAKCDLPPRENAAILPFRQVTADSQS